MYRKESTNKKLFEEIEKDRYKINLMSDMRSMPPVDTHSLK